jgi:hypothetical protein
MERTTNIFRGDTLLIFNELDVPERKTKVWEVRNQDGDFLGTISWKNTWRRYWWEQANSVGMDASCLDEVSAFIKREMIFRTTDNLKITE